jgi:hypothetical protein
MGLVPRLKLNRKASGQTPWGRNQASIRCQPSAAILDVIVHSEVLLHHHHRLRWSVPGAASEMEIDGNWVGTGWEITTGDWESCIHRSGRGNEAR